MTFKFFRQYNKMILIIGVSLLQSEKVGRWLGGLVGKKAGV